jgi:hypothetical protein
MIKLPFLISNVLVVVISFALIGIGIWVCVSVGPNLLALLLTAAQSFIKGIKGKTTLPWTSPLNASIGLFIIFIIGITLIISGIFIIKFVKSGNAS